jgi:hypothetical protein
MLALVVACVSFAASAQDAQALSDKVHFDPTRDLVGYEAVRTSVDRDLYPLDEFDALLGNELSPAELAAVQQRWATARGAVDAKLADLAADPRAAFLFRLEFKLGRHGFFSKIGWSVEPAPEPFVLVVQRPPKEDPAHADRIAQLYQPWLAALSAQFTARVVAPTQVQPNPARGAVPLVVLATPSDLQTAARFVDGDISSVFGGIHDAELGLDIGNDDPFNTSKSVRSRVTPLVTAAVVGLLQRYQVAGEVPGSVLLTKGVQHYLIEVLGDGTRAVEVPRPRADDLMNAMAILGDARKRVEVAIRLPDLLAIVDDKGFDGLAERQARKAEVQSLFDRRAFWDGFRPQCALWTHFLIDGDGRAHRAQWTRYVREVLAGKDAPDAAKIAFEGADLVAIERAFWTWIVAATKTYFPTSVIPSPDAIELLLAGPPPAIAAAPEPTPTKAAGPAPALPPLDPKLLAVAANDMDARMGLALVRARSNDLDGALSDLRALASTQPVDPFAGRIAREVARLEAVVALRDGWLSALAAKGGRLEIELEGKKINAPVRSIENGVVLLAPSKFGVDRVALADLRLVDILRATEKREYQGTSAPWVRGYLAAMADDPRADKYTKGDAPEPRDLREDTRVWIDAGVRTGNVARILAEIAAQPLPTSRGEGAIAIERVRAILADAELPCVALRRELLVRYARASLAAMASAMEAGDFVHGQWTKTGDDDVGLVYDFDRPEEAADFAKHAGYLPELREKYEPLMRAEAQASVEAVGGRAVFLGPACWRLPIGFQAPFQVRYTVRVVHVDGELAPNPTFDVLACDDMKESFVRATVFGWIWVNDLVTGRTAEANPVETITYLQDTDYSVEAVHDGARMTTRLDDKDRASCAIGTLTGGDIVLFVHTDLPVSLERFEITGRVDKKSLGRARARWVDRQMTELGL